MGNTDLARIYNPQKEVGQYLNDFGCEVFMSIVCMESNDPNSVLLLSSAFMTQLKDGFENIKYKSRGWLERNRDWTEKFKKQMYRSLNGRELGTIRIIIVPVVLANHWFIAVIRPSLYEIKYHDSLNLNQQHSLWSLQVFMKRILPLQEGASWKIWNGGSVAQQDNTSCGAYACINAECVVKG